MIEFRLLEHALALAEHGSFAVASQALGISQPALSRSIQSLEAGLEVQLFDRGHRRIEPTDAGQIFLEHAREIVARNAALLREMGMAQQNQAASFTLAAGPYPAETLLGTVLAAAIGLHPEIQLRLRVESWAEAVKLVRSREADLCVADVSQLGDDPDLHAEPLGPLQGYFVVRAGHPLLALDLPSAEQVCSYPLVCTSRLPPRILSPLQQQRAAAATRKPSPFPAQLCDSLSVMRQIVAHSQAVGLFVLPSITAELRSGALVPLPGESPWLHTQFGIIHARRRPLTDVGESLVQCIRAAAAGLVETEGELAREFAPWRGNGRD